MAEALWATISRAPHGRHHARPTFRPTPSRAPPSMPSSRRCSTAYEQHLATRRLADTRRRLPRGAASTSTSAPSTPGDLWIELPGVIWSPLERRLLDSLPRRPDRAADARTCPGSSARGAPTWARASSSQPPPPARTPSGSPVSCGRARRRRRGRRHARACSAPAAARPRSRRSSGASSRPACALDQVEIACASADDATLVWEKAQRHDWPVTVGRGVPVTLTRPARALLAFCDVGRGRASRPAALRRLLQSGDVRLDLDDGPSAGQAARLLAQIGGDVGTRDLRARRSTRLADRAASARPTSRTTTRRARATPQRAAQAERLGAWIARPPRAGAAAADGPAAAGAAGSTARRVSSRRFASKAERDGRRGGGRPRGCAGGAAGRSGTSLAAAREALALIRHRLERPHGRRRPRAARASPRHDAAQAGLCRPPAHLRGGAGGGPRLPGAAWRTRCCSTTSASARARAAGLPADRVGEALYRVVSRLAVLGGRCV